ncbi:hypothetical protein CCYA_CCYA02G0528 [Cyanidiococcus yangmingshanensis]|nr:hypothetical protein CCYA_CCYA02G0528 [Cyanidiococcus yangmingshanensis]
MDGVGGNRAPDSERVLKSERSSLDERFLPFERQTGEGGVRCLLQWLAAPLLLPLRLLLCLTIAVLFYVACIIFGPQVDKNAARDGFIWSLPRWRARVLRGLTRTCARTALFVLGFYRIRRTYLQGYDRARHSEALVVSNHVSLFDILFFMADDGRSFVSKHTMLQVPLIGRIAATIGCIFVNRARHSGGRATSLVVQRQQEMWAGVASAHRTATQPPPPLVLFPEGTTTNGKYLLAFKTGAFVAGLPVQPVILAYEQRCFSLAYETIRGWKYILGVFRQFANQLNVIYMPLYIPNEEEKADPRLFANNVRLQMFKVMQAQFGTLLSDSSYADKLAYHTRLRKSWGEYVPIDPVTTTDHVHTE